MGATTLLTTWFHRRSLRHVWLVVGVVGAAACVWWLSSLDNFTPKEHVAVILACWGAFLGLIPPAFLTDEIEGLNPKDSLYALDSRILGAICRKSFFTKRLCYMQSRSYYRESMFVSSCSIRVCDILPKNPRI